MSKVAGGFARFVFGFLILAAVGYNFWQIRQLRAEIATLKSPDAPRSSLQSGGRDSAAAASSLPQDALHEAQRRAERAQELLRTKKYAEAKREVALAADALKRSRDAAQKESRDALQNLQETARSLARKTGKLWEQQEDTSPETDAHPAKKESEKKTR